MTAGRILKIIWKFVVFCFEVFLIGMLMLVSFNAGMAVKERMEYNYYFHSMQPPPPARELEI